MAAKKPAKKAGPPKKAAPPKRKKKLKGLSENPAASLALLARARGRR